MPERLVRDCDTPTAASARWRDIATVAAERKLALEECNGRLRALREALQ